jgi:hypothetical protein
MTTDRRGALAGQLGRLLALRQTAGRSDGHLLDRFLYGVLAVELERRSCTLHGAEATTREPP